MKQAEMLQNMNKKMQKKDNKVKEQDLKIKIIQGVMNSYVKDFNKEKSKMKQVEQRSRDSSSAYEVPNNRDVISIED